jgi:Caspase domain
MRRRLREAADGDGEHGIYTHHLLQAMLTPGLSIEQVFKQVRYEVVAETGGRQTPWESSSLLGGFAFVPTHATPLQAVRPPYPSAASDPETVMWSMSERSSHPEDVLAFLQLYPGSRFALAARLHLQQLQGKSPPAGSGLAQQPPGSAPPPSVEGPPLSSSPSASPSPPVDGAVPPTVSSAATSCEDAGSPPPRPVLCLPALPRAIR